MPCVWTFSPAFWAMAAIYPVLPNLTSTTYCTKANEECIDWGNGCVLLSGCLIVSSTPRIGVLNGFARSGPRVLRVLILEIVDCSWSFRFVHAIWVDILGAFLCCQRRDEGFFCYRTFINACVLTGQHRGLSHDFWQWGTTEPPKCLCMQTKLSNVRLSVGASPPVVHWEGLSSWDVIIESAKQETAI